MEQLTLFAEDSLVSHSVLPGSEEARRMTAISGRKWLELFPRSGPLGSLERMLLESSNWHSTMYFLTWKASDTPAGRLLYRLAPSAPRTEEREFSSWPTPHANCHTGAGTHGDGGPNLQTAVKMWPTPAAQDGKNATLPPSQKNRDTIPGAVIRTGENGQLNPAWVETLMGFPIGWTEPDGPPLSGNHSTTGSRPGWPSE